VGQLIDGIIGIAGVTLGLLAFGSCIGLMRPGDVSFRWLIAAAGWSF